MKKFWVRLLLILLLLGAVAVLFNIIGRKILEKKDSARNVVVQRITHEVEENAFSESASTIDYDSILNSVFNERRSEWESLYGRQACPTKVRSIPIFRDDSEEDRKLSANCNTITSGVYIDNQLTAILEFDFLTDKNTKILILINVFFIISVLIIVGYAFWIYIRIIKPFNKLSDYPERLSKGEPTEKLPESKDKLFGKYIWSMNMLSDKMENSRKGAEKISLEHQSRVTTLVHGIKTPAASIKLLAEAIATGLYSPDGKVNEKDAELAEKIKKNADEIERIVSETLDSSNTAIFDYDPNVEPFYRIKIVEYINEEYSNRLKLNRIPLNVENEGNPLIKSDFDGICRILRQLMDNAIKYGDGTSITLRMEKNDEGHFITVENNGTPLPESEVSFVFNSLWRGSNASNVEGSGVGLYEARYIARKLGGDIRMRTGDNTTAVTIFIP